MPWLSLREPDGTGQCIGPEAATLFVGIEPGRECAPVPEVQPFCQPGI